MNDGVRSAPETLSGVDWQIVTTAMNENGYALVPEVLSYSVCDEIAGDYDTGRYRKTVTMERHRFGRGEYKYYDHPLPSIVGQLRDQLYPRLAPIANQWSAHLGIDVRYPLLHTEFLSRCHDAGQLKPTPLILKYGTGGFNTLHQDLYGEVYFPMQAAFFLNEPDTDYTGGEFVLTEQVPRAQSRAMVLTPRKGDMIIFTTNFRAVRGSRGYYRANMRHGVSEVRDGIRHTLGVIFHDAQS